MSTATSVKVCGQSVSISSGIKALDEAKLTSTEINSLRTLTRDLSAYSARYVRGLIAIEGLGQRQLSIE